MSKQGSRSRVLEVLRIYPVKIHKVCYASLWGLGNPAKTWLLFGFVLCFYLRVRYNVGVMLTGP